MDKSGKIRIAGYSLMAIGFIIGAFPLFSGDKYFQATPLYTVFAVIVVTIGGVIDSIGYRIEKKAYEKELREKE